MAIDPNRVNWDACTLEKITEMVSRRVYADRDTGATIVQTHLRKGVIVPVHTHAGEQRIQVVQGAIVVSIGGTVISRVAGESLTVPANAPHQLEATEDSVVLDVRFGDPQFGPA